MAIMNQKICDACANRADLNACLTCFNGSRFTSRIKTDDRAKPTAGDVLKSYNEFCRTRTKIVNRSVKIKNVIFNPPATIVFWTDNSKTVVKAQEGDIFDPEKGLAMAISKRALGNQGNYFNEISKWTEKYDNVTGPDYYNTFMEKFIAPNHRTLSDLLNSFYKTKLTNKWPPVEE